MDQAQFLMWSKRRHNLSPHLKLGKNLSSYDDSWEERAFAEDASGPLGGCIWPPRSYSCSFCRREFRSAQALGGHMNVHRRDRARLKQLGSEILSSHEYQDQPSHLQGSSAPLGLSYSSQAYNTSPSHKPDPNSNLFPYVSPSSASRVSAPPSERSCNPRILTFPSYSPFILNENSTKSPIHSPQSWPDEVGSRDRHIMYPLIGEKNSGSTKRPDGDIKEDPGKNDLSVGLNVVIRTRPDPSDDVEESQSCKRRRKDESSLLPFSVKNLTVDSDRCHQKEACALSSYPGEDLDLELRLGGWPKVKLQS